MDEGIIRTCQSAESHLLSGGDRDPADQFSTVEFKQQWSELLDWLGHVRTKATRAEIMCRAENYLDNGAYEDLLARLPRRQLLCEYAAALCKLYPQMESEISAKMTELQRCWEGLENELMTRNVEFLHANSELVLTDLAYDLNELQHWLASLIDPPHYSEWHHFLSTIDAEEKKQYLLELQKQEQDFQTKVRAINAIRKVLDKLFRQDHSGSLEEFQRLRCQELFDLLKRLESRFHELWLQVLELRFSLEQESQPTRTLTKFESKFPGSWGTESGFVSELSPSNLPACLRSCSSGSLDGLSESGSYSSVDILPFSEDEYEKIRDSSNEKIFAIDDLVSSGENNLSATPGKSTSQRLQSAIIAHKLERRSIKRAQRGDHLQRRRQRLSYRSPPLSPISSVAMLSTERSRPLCQSLGSTSTSTPSKLQQQSISDSCVHTKTDQRQRRSQKLKLQAYLENDLCNEDSQLRNGFVTCKVKTHETVIRKKAIAHIAENTSCVSESELCNISTSADQSLEFYPAYQLGDGECSHHCHSVDFDADISNGNNNGSCSCSCENLNCSVEVRHNRGAYLSTPLNYYYKMTAIDNDITQDTEGHYSFEQETSEVLTGARTSDVQVEALQLPDADHESSVVIEENGEGRNQVRHISERKSKSSVDLKSHKTSCQMTSSVSYNNSLNANNSSNVNYSLLPSTSPQSLSSLDFAFVKLKNQQNNLDNRYCSDSRLLRAARHMDDADSSFISTCNLSMSGKKRRWINTKSSSETNCELYLDVNTLEKASSVHNSLRELVEDFDCSEEFLVESAEEVDLNQNGAVEASSSVSQEESWKHLVDQLITQQQPIIRNGDNALTDTVTSFGDMSTDGSCADESSASCSSRSSPQLNLRQKVQNDSSSMGGDYHSLPTVKMRRRSLKTKGQRQFRTSLKLAEQADRYLVQKTMSMGQVNGRHSFEDQSGLDDVDLSPDGDGLDQAWDNYQAPLYPVTADDLYQLEEKMDDDHLQWEADPLDASLTYNRLYHKVVSQTHTNSRLEQVDIGDLVDQSHKQLSTISLELQSLFSKSDSSSSCSKRYNDLESRVGRHIACTRTLLTKVSSGENNHLSKYEAELTSLLQEWEAMHSEVKYASSLTDFIEDAALQTSEIHQETERISSRMQCDQFSSSTDIIDYLSDLKICEMRLHENLTVVSGIHSKMSSMLLPTLNHQQQAERLALIEKVTFMTKWLASLRERCGSLIFSLQERVEKCKEFETTMTECQRILAEEEHHLRCAKHSFQLILEESQAAVVAREIQEIAYKCSECDNGLNHCRRTFSELSVLWTSQTLQRWEEDLGLASAQVDRVKSECLSLLTQLDKEVVVRRRVTSPSPAVSPVLTQSPRSNYRLIVLGGVGLVIILLAYFSTDCFKFLEEMRFLRVQYRDGAPI